MLPPVGPTLRIRCRWKGLRRHRPGVLGPLLGLTLGLTALAAALAAESGRAEADTPFALRRHAIRGVVEQVWPLRVADCAHPAHDLLVLSAEGSPPEQTRWLLWMPCGSALSPGAPRIVERRLAPETVVVDVARIPGRPGPQLVELDGDGLRISSLEGRPAPRRLAVPGGLPLPPRPWEIGRLQVVDDWQGDGRPMALVPALRGGWLVDLESGAAREIRMPVHADYRTWSPALPEAEWRWLEQEVTWPVLARGDDDGDGRPDLFALARWAIAVYHAGPEGLPSEPSRTLPLRPFDAEQERDHRATADDYLARDLDGDGRADLLLTTIGGGLMDGRSATRIHLNPGAGVEVDGPPAASRTVDRGFSRIHLVDLEGDGRLELLETRLDFGVVQIVRFLLTRRAELRLRLLTLDAEAPDGLRTLFEEDLSFRIDFGESRVAGLVPGLGDWNGDGRLDFFVTRGDDAIGFRVAASAEAVAAGADRFGPTVGEQPVPLPSGRSRTADLDGDGLDEIVAWNDRDPKLPLIVLENLGRLPGTRPTVGPIDDPD